MSERTALEDINDNVIRNGYSSAFTSDFKDVVRVYFWHWYDSNLDKKVKLSLFKGLLRPTFTVKDLKPIFNLLFGAR